MVSKVGSSDRIVMGILAALVFCKTFQGFVERVSSGFELFMLELCCWVLGWVKSHISGRALPRWPNDRTGTALDSHPTLLWGPSVALAQCRVLGGASLSRSSSAPRFLLSTSREMCLCLSVKILRRWLPSFMVWGLSGWGNDSMPFEARPRRG